MKNVIRIILLLLLAVQPQIIKAKEYKIPRAAYSVFATDLDLDGDIDIVVGHKTGWEQDNPTISTMWNDGNGNFDYIDTSISFCGYQENILAVDVNADDYPDIVTFKSDHSTGTADRYIRIIYNNEGTFTEYSDFSLNSSERFDFINYCDIDDDEDIDIIVSSNVGRFVGILYNDGKGNFTDPKYYYYDTPVGDIASGDLNNDGRQDIAVAISTTKLSLFYNLPTGLDRALTTYDTTVTYGMTSIMVVDINNDGVNEIAGVFSAPAPKGLFIVLSKTGEKSYAVAYKQYVDEAIAYLFSADLDNDTFPEIIYNSTYYYPLSEYETYHTYILYNNKDGTFQEPVNYQTFFGNSKGYVQSIKSSAADLDNNGWKDIITVNYAYLASTINILFNDGHGNFLGDPIVGIKDEPLLAHNFILNQNYPNPFNSSTEITYQLPRRDKVSLAIYDVRGEEIARLIKAETRSEGTHSIRWFGRNAKGKEVSNGVFFYVLEGSNYRDVKKMILLK